MAQFSLRVLGTLELDADTRPVIRFFRSDKIRALLIFLAMESGRPHQRRALATMLWSEFSEQAALGNLRKALFYLRETLNRAGPGCCESLLTIDRQSVQFNLINFDVDALCFQRLLTDVEEHIHQSLDSCPSCRARLIQAEELYRGDLLPGFTLSDAAGFEEWALPVQEHLRQKAILCLHHLSAIFEREEDFERAEKYAIRLMHMDPYREKTARQLMRIFSKTDRRSAALELYKRLSGRLQSEIGVYPGERTTRLFQKISGGESGKADQLVNNLHGFPTNLTPFWGRKGELNQIETYLADSQCPLLTILGPGGAGKTRLAIEAVSQIDDKSLFSEGIYFIRLDAADSGDDLLVALINTLPIDPGPTTSLLAQITDYLRSRRCLLVLDNFDRLIGSEGIVADILLKAPDVKLLVTSRQPLYLRAEQQIRISGLAYPDRPFSETEIISIREALAYDAIHFFVRKAQHVQPEFSLCAANLQAVFDITYFTWGNPLVLEIAAGWVRVMDVESVLESIHRSPDFLASPMHDQPDRHRSMRAVFDNSWELLSPSEQLALAKASIFLEPFSMATAVIVLDSTIKDIAALLDKSLLHSPALGRYEMHELLRQYALGKLRTMPNGDEIEAQVQRKHSAHFLNLVSRSTPGFFGSDPRTTALAFRQRLGNIIKAWSWAIEHAAEPEQQCLVNNSMNGIGRFYDFWGMAGEGEKMIRAGVAAYMALVNDSDDAFSAAPIILSRLLAWHAHFKTRLGSIDDGVQTARDALAYGKHDPEAAANAKGVLGELLPNIGQFDQAETLQNEALTYYRLKGNKREIAHTMGRLGIIYWRRGEYDQAVEILDQALALEESLGNKSAMALLSGAIAGVHYEQDHHEMAQTYVEQAQLYYSEIGSVIGVAQTDGYLALLHLKSGRYELALAHNQHELGVYLSIGDRQLASTTIGNRGSILLEKGDFEESIACYEEAIHLTGELGLTWHLAMHQCGLAAAWHEKGDDDRAMALYNEALPVLREHGAPFYVVAPLIGKTRILLANDHLEEAQHILSQALPMAERLNQVEYVFEARIMQANLECRQGKTCEARRFLLDLLKRGDDPAEQAKIYYELWRLDGQEEHARSSYELYRELCEQLPKYTYKRHLDELKSVLQRE